MKKQEAKEKLIKADKIIITFEDWGYSREYGSTYPYFNLYVLSIKDGELKVEKIKCEESGYWSKRKQAYGMKIWGMSRYFELLWDIVDDSDLANKLYSKTLIL